MKFTLIFNLIISFLVSCSPKQPEESEDTAEALLGMGYGIDNSMLLVHDIETASKYYKEVLGFNMPSPDKYKKNTYEGTVSALTSFSNLANLELIAVKDTQIVANNYPSISNFLSKREGAGGFALSTSSAKETNARLDSLGFDLDSIQSGRQDINPTGWSPDDGGPQWFRVGFVKKSHSYHYPEFIENASMPYDYIRKDWEAIYPWLRNNGDYKQPNGVVGMVAVRIAVKDLPTERSNFRKLGLVEIDVDKSETISRFDLRRGQELHLLATGNPDEVLSDFFEKNESGGIYALRFEVADLCATDAFLSQRLPVGALLKKSFPERLVVPSEHAYGVQLEFVQESPTQFALVKNFQPGSKLDTASQVRASKMYQQYCALCHGKDREGNAADFAPSLKSHSLLATSQNTNFMRYTISYGRAGTAMAGYLKEQGGPMEYGEIELLLQWLMEESGVSEPVELTTDAIVGDVKLGKNLYVQHCAVCHGDKGEGVSAPALGNPMLLAIASDAFLRYAIAEGRDGTAMPAFKDSLKTAEINALTAYLRSRAAGWEIPEVITFTEPKPENYIQNPEGPAPNFKLKEDRFVPAEQVLKALQDSARIVILDARSKAAWRQMHIPGAVPVPYYNDPDTFAKDMPKDGTWIVVYCACPHAASGVVVNTLRRLGYKNTAIIDEGILVWAQRKYPVRNGS
jgi:cbb3-type cytochrome c oxidase subunit III